MVQSRRHRVRHAWMGRLVQQPQIARTDWSRAAGRVRSGVLCIRGGFSQHGGNHAMKSPGEPGAVQVGRRRYCCLCSVACGFTRAWLRARPWISADGTLPLPQRADLCDGASTHQLPPFLPLGESGYTSCEFCSLGDPKMNCIVLLAATVAALVTSTAVSSGRPCTVSLVSLV